MNSSIQPVIIDAATQHEVILTLSGKLRASYIHPAVAEEICGRLLRHLEDGDYTENAEGELFALALTLHLQEVNHDEHLWVRWHPVALPEGEDILRNSEEWQEARRTEARLENFGIHKLERLPGNVGYIEIRFFHRAVWGRETAIAAMNFLANAGALIIDLRKCTGGYPDMLALVMSYLFEGDPVHLFSIYWRDDDITQQYWTEPCVPGQRFGSQPIFVLTSRSTFSAGEEFAAILQNHQRGIVVGEKTDGGAHPGASYRLHPHFEAFIPVGRAFDPLTGNDIEGIGIRPDIPIPEEQAYLAAYQHALRAILAGLPTPPVGALKASNDEARSALEELVSRWKFCPRCGFQNDPSDTRCRNCDQAWPTEP